ncbi:PIG-L deacetylase family protein [Streptosporangium sp. NPDC000396]|uniref:PIG-L deacetylase family protein n=1 Tax=Streptosporangium sp. NPDC000396 TaxID=3366185 RepID=UPI0036C7C69E
MSARTIGTPITLPAQAGPIEPMDDRLPKARHVLAVVAHPGEEAATLGAVLEGFLRDGAQISVLILTRGEASPYNSTTERLASVRPCETQVSASVLGVSHVVMADFPDGLLDQIPLRRLAECVTRAVTEFGADLLLTIDPIGAEDCPGDEWAAHAAAYAGRILGIPVLAWTLPAAPARLLGYDNPARPDICVNVDRTVQKRAMRAHRSQEDGQSRHRRRLDLQGDHEWLCRLRG